MAAPLRSLTPGRRNPGLDNAPRSQNYPRANFQPQQQQPVMSPRPSGPVAILWDIENCPVPGEVNAEDVARNIRIALRDQPHIGAVTMFSAYGDFNHFPKKVREGCQRTGVNLIDVPNGKKDAADKAILVDMFLFALDNPCSTIVLVTGDVDFAPALHKLGQRGYVVILVIPDGVGVSPALKGAGRYVWDWPSLCRGEGLVKARSNSTQRAPNVVHNHTLFTAELPANQYPEIHTESRSIAADDDDDDHVIGEEILVQRRHVYNGAHSPHVNMYSQVHTTPIDYGHQTYAFPGHMNSHGPWMNPSVHGVPSRNAPSASASVRNNRSIFPTPEVVPAIQPGFQAVQVGEMGFPLDTAEPTSPGGTSWVQPGDVAGLKKQLVRLLKQNGGKLTLVKVPAEYNKQYGRPLYLSEYNAQKLVHLLEKMKDALVVKGDGMNKTLHLIEKVERKARNPGNKYKPSTPRSSTPKGDKDSRETSEDSDPEVTVKEAIKAEFSTIDVPNKRHLLDLDMDDAKQAFSLPVDWESGNDLKAKPDATKPETVVDVGEVFNSKDQNDMKLDHFKRELEELLVVYALEIRLKELEQIYYQRYTRVLDLQHLGVDSLETLFQKVKDIAVLKEKVVEEEGEPSGKQLFVVAVCNRERKT